jgi:glycosyltransferase involved in cell wall biosynthesis
MFLPWAPTYGGGVNGVVNGLALACRDRYDPVIVVTSWCRPPDYDGPWLYLPDLNPARPLGFLARLVPVILRLRTILKGAVAANPHFGGLECIPLVLMRRMGLGPPVIMSVHGSDVTEMLASTGRRRRLYRWLFASFDLVVGCSGALTRRLLELSPSARTVAIWNATPEAPEVRPERPVEGPYLLCVAAFVQKKGHDVLLSAFARIGAARPDLTLVLIGSSGPTLREIEARVEGAGMSSRVRILIDLPNPEVWWWMKHAECFVLASLDEPFGIVLLEAGKSRVPIVATRVGGVPEFLTDREHGLLCDSGDPVQLADAVLATLSDCEATTRRVEAFYRKAREFTWSATFEAYRTAADLP